MEPHVQVTSVLFMSFVFLVHKDVQTLHVFIIITIIHKYSKT